LKESKLLGHPAQPASPLPIHRRVMLIPATRSLMLTVLLLSSVATIAQTVASAGNPYTAVKKTTIIQKLGDGTTITRENSTTEARDSQGRTMAQNPMGEMQGQNITITHVMDPFARTNTTWLSRGKQATRMHLPDLRGAAQQSGPTAMGLGSGSIGAVSNVTSLSPAIRIGGTGTAPETTGIVTMSAGAVRDPNLRPERKTEKLGGKTIAGVYAEGTRLTVIYPVGSFGNDKPIITFHETWMSSDLKLILLSVDDDPRTGTRITEVTTLDRGEPNPALFQVPEGYTIKDQYPGTN
jgi:hypothetical protein